MGDQASEAEMKRLQEYMKNMKWNNMADKQNVWKILQTEWWKHDSTWTIQKLLEEIAWCVIGLI